MPKKRPKGEFLEESAKKILAALLTEFRERSLSTKDLQNGYQGLSLVLLRSACCTDGQISDVDFDLAMKDLNDIGLLKTRPMAAYDNTPGSELVFIGLYSKKEYAYLTEDGYKIAAKLDTLKPVTIPTPQIGTNMTQASSTQQNRRPLSVFISYSWDSEEHKKWVLAFAKGLREHGIDAIIDQTHLPLGARTPEFMEGSVRESGRVLVVCTEMYKQRFDNRKGGAGYEGHIITGEIVNEVGKNKFIPILRKGNWKAAIPTALLGVHGVDLRNDSLDEYRKLIESLHDISRIPPVGQRPTWLGGASESSDGRVSTTPVDGFDDFARKHDKEVANKKRLAKETKSEWEVLKGLVSRFGLDGKGIDNYKFEWNPDLSGHPLLVLNNASAILSEGSHRDGVLQSYRVRFSRKPAGPGRAYVDSESLVPAKTWSVEPDIWDDKFVWFVFEKGRRMSAAELANEIAKELARYHIEYEKAYGGAGWS